MSQIVFKRGDVTTSDRVHDYFQRLFQAEATGEEFPFIPKGLPTPAVPALADSN